MKSSTNMNYHDELENRNGKKFQQIFVSKILPIKSSTNMNYHDELENKNGKKFVFE